MKSVTTLRFKAQCDDDAEVRHVAEVCRRARNAALENWLLRQRGLPESEKQRKTSPKPDKDGNPRPLSESTKLYHAVRAEAPELNTQAASMIAAAISSHLAAKQDWRRGGGGKRKDAILNYEDRPPFFSGLEIPLHNSQVALSVGDDVSIRIRSPLGNGDLTISFSGKGMNGHRRVLEEITSGARKLSDSKLIFKPHKNAWYWHLPVVFETEVRSDVEVTLYPVIGIPAGRHADNFLRLELPGRSWMVGHGRFLLSQTLRLIGIRKAIGWRYRNGQGSGHGRQKIDAAVRKRRMQQRNIVCEVRRQAVNDVMRQCDRAGAGVIVYREPSLPLRKKTWFSEQGLEWDWTAFLMDLKNVAARRGVEVVKKQYRWKDAQNDGYIAKKDREADAA